MKPAQKTLPLPAKKTILPPAKKMNVCPTIQRKDIAQKAGVSVDTVARRYTRILAPAICRSVKKPLTYFRARASRILIDSGIIEDEI